jgi:phage RecT family recombinase
MNQQNTALASRVNGFRSDLYKKAKSFASLMSVSDVKDQRFVSWMAEVAHVVSLNPRLLKADRESLLQALRTALTLHMSINPLLGEAWLIPRWDRNANCELVSCQIGYQGLKAMMYRSELIDSIHADVAYRGEDFEYYSGSEPRIVHRPDVTGELRTNKFEDIICAYASVLLKGSERPLIRLCTQADLGDARSMNLDRNGNPSRPWIDNTEAMCWKVALARVTKSAPRAKGLAAVHELLNQEATRAQVEQMDPPQAAPPPPESEEPSRWVVACEHYQDLGISTAAVLRHVSRESPDDVTDADLDALESLYGAARSGNDEAKGILDGLKSST